MSLENREEVRGTRLASCSKCGTKTVKQFKVKSGGCSVPHRNTTVQLPQGAVIMKCERCHYTYVEKSELERLQLSLHEAYQDQLKMRIKVSIGVLMGHITQRRLELLLGLSQGYLSRLRSGAGNPSPELVSHLALLAVDPEKRLAELKQYWSREPTP